LPPNRGTDTPPIENVASPTLPPKRGTSKPTTEGNAKIAAAAAEKKKKETAEQTKILAEKKVKDEKLVADKAAFIRQQQESYFESEMSALKSAMADVTNPDQYDRVNKFFATMLKNPMCQPEGRDKTILEEAKTLLKKLEHLYLLREAIAKLNQKTIAEIRSFDQPKPEIIETMACTYLLLGENPKSLKKKGEMDWNLLRALIGKMGKVGLKRRIAAFTVAGGCALPKKTLRMATELSNKVDVARVSEVSQGAATFYAWCKGVLDEINTEVTI
jgi:hypothetical protein